MNSQRQQESEGVVREQHEIHAGEEGGKERQYALRLMLVPAIADARRGWRPRRRD